MIRRRLVVAFSTLLLLLVAFVSVAAVIGVTQTSWGRAKVRSLVLAELRRAVHGRIYIGNLSGTLFTNLTLDSLEIRDPAGQVMVATGRIHAEYDPRDLLDRRILLQDLEIDRPYFRLVHHHDGTMNLSQVFPPSRSRIREPGTRGFGDYIVAHNVRIRGAAFYFSERWSPDDSLHGARRDSAIAEALARPYFGLERWPEGLMRTLSWKGVNLEYPYLRFVDPDSAGMAFELARLDADEFFPPFRIANARGQVSIAHDTLRATLPHAELPGSVVAGGGKVWWDPGRPPIYALHFTSDSIALNDIAWVNPALPRTGGGRAIVDIRSERSNPSIVDFIISNLDVRTTESRVKGDMTFESGRPELVIKNVALEALPVDFALIRVFAGGQPFPIDWAGQWTGRVRGPGGPLSHWRVDTADLTLHDGHVADAVSRLGGSGELDITNPAVLAFRHFRLSLDRLDLRTLQYVLSEFPRLHGIVSGTATLDSVWNDVRFTDADVTQTDGDAVPNHVTGAGRFTLGDTESRYDMALQAGPISFTTLARTYTGLPLRGEFSGPVTLQGTLDNLDLTADLGGAPGAFTLDGHFDLTRPGLSGSGALTLAHMDLQSLLDDSARAQTDLSGRVDIDVKGDSLSALDGPISATLARSTIGRVRLDTGRFVGRFGPARLRVDSLSIDTRAGALTGAGGLALAAGVQDSLQLAFSTDSLGGLRAYLVGETDSVQRSPLGGALRVSTAVTGWLDSLGVSGTVGGSGIRAGGVVVRGLSGTFDVPRLNTETPLGTADFAFEGASIAGVALDRIAFQARFLGTGSTTVALQGTMPTGPHGGALVEIHQSADTLAVTLDSLAVYTHNNAWHLAAPAHFTHDATGLALDNFTLRGAVVGAMTATASLPWTGSGLAELRGDSVPIGDIGEILQTSTSYGGVARWDVHMSGERANPTMELQASLNDASLGDVHLEETLLRGRYGNRRLLLHGDLVQGGDTTLHGEVSVPVDLALLPGVRRVLDDSLTGDVRADSVGFSAVAAMYPALQNPKGSFATNLRIAGTLQHPLLTGDIRLVNGEAGFPRLGVRFSGMNADLRLAGDSLAVQDVTVNSLNGQTRGHAMLRGWLTFADLTNPKFDFSLSATDLHALSNPRVADVLLSTEPNAPLHLRGELSSSQLSGAVLVDRGTIFLPDILAQKKIVSLSDPQLYDLVDTSRYENRSLLPSGPPRLLQNLSFNNVQVALGSDVWLRSSEASINLTTGDQPLIVTTAPTERDSTKSLALSGTLVANRGTYRLNLGVVQRTFTVDSGTVRFRGNADNDPEVNIRATYVVRQATSTATGSLSPDVPIDVVLGGTLSDPQVKLTSPDSLLSLSPQDLLSYLVTGQQSLTVGQGGSTTNTGAQVAQFVLPTVGTAISSRIPGQVLDYVNFQTGASDPTQQSGFSTVFTSTRISGGKQLGRSTFVSADLGVCALGAGAGAAAPPSTASQIGVRVEQQLTRNFSLAASSEPGTADLYCSTGALSRSFVPQPRQWGLDLAHTWRF
jgi:translocation and assembly module TamB